MLVRFARAPRLPLAILFLRVLALAMVSLHPEHAKPRGLDAVVERGGNRQPQHPARIGGIDHAVVPQARAGVVRMPFALVLLPQRRLERRDRKSTRLNSSHVAISYAVFCLK